MLQSALADGETATGGCYLHTVSKTNQKRRILRFWQDEAGKLTKLMKLKTIINFTISEFSPEFELKT